MSREKIGPFSIASAFSATLIGAGFASGQELLQFFVVYGKRGYWGLALASALSSALAVMVMARARRAGGAASALSGKAMRGVMAFFFFGLLTVMVAGGDSLCRGYGAPPLVGGLLTAGLTAATVGGGMKSVVRSFNVATPFMVAVAAAVALAVLAAVPAETAPVSWAGQGRWTGSWLTASLLFVSYNLLSACGVLEPLGAAASGGRAVAAGAALGGGIMGGLAFLLCAAMGGRVPSVARHPLPMLALANGLHPLAGAAYGLALFAGIYTTAVGCMTGLADRCGVGEGPRRWLLSAGTAALALAGSRLGFARLVSRVYPVSGAAAAVILAAMAAELIIRAARKNGGFCLLWIRLPGGRRKAE